MARKPRAETEQIPCPHCGKNMLFSGGKDPPGRLCIYCNGELNPPVAGVATLAIGFDIHCPYCGTARSVAEGEVGHAVRCSKCGADLSVDERIAKARASLVVSQRLEERRSKQQALVAGELADRFRRDHGGGCPRCGSANLAQRRHTTSTGYGLFVAGLVAAVFTLGLSLILSVIGVFLSEKRARCRKCRWEWRV